MRRSISLVSAAITAFSIVLMATVAYGLHVAAGPRSEAPSVVSAAPLTSAPPRVKDEAPSQTGAFSAQAAAALASTFLGRTDALTVQLADYNGVQAYLVTFASGDLVYVSLSGEVLGTVPAPVQMASSGRHEKEHEGGTGGGGGAEGGEHEPEPEHETEVGN